MGLEFRFQVLAFRFSFRVFRVQGVTPLDSISSFGGYKAAPVQFKTDGKSFKRRAGTQVRVSGLLENLNVFILCTATLSQCIAETIFIQFSSDHKPITLQVLKASALTASALQLISVRLQK